jgi:ABC-type glycerol-3-phosphate transport system substrate-binding protein
MSVRRLRFGFFCVFVMACGLISLWPATKELTLWEHSNPTFIEIAKQNIADFEQANPDVKIRIEEFPYQQLIDKLAPAFASGTQPDLLEVPAFTMSFQMKTGQLSAMPASIFDVSTIEKTFFSAGIRGLSIEKGGKRTYYGVPMEVNVGWGQAILIDRDAFNEAGVNEKNWKTWDDYIRDLQKLTLKDSSGKITRSGLEVVVASWAHIWVGTYHHLGQGTVPEFNADNTVAWNNAFGRKVLQTIDDYVNKYKIASLDLADLVCLGKKTAAAQQQGPWITASYLSDYPNLKWEYVRIPNMPGVKNPCTGTFGGWGWFVTSKSKYQDVAWKFLKSRAEPENAVQFALKTNSIPARIAAANDPRIADSPAFKAWIPLIPYQIPMADYGIGAEEIRKVISDMIMGVWLKKATVDASISDAAQKVNAIRKRYKEIK